MNTYFDEPYLAHNINDAKNKLEQYGIAIIPDILSLDECAIMENGAWDCLETISKEWSIPLSRNDQTTWRSFENFCSLHNMLIQHWIGHADFLWQLRQHPKIIDVFNCIHNTQDLLTSFDGASIHLPPEITNRGYFRDNLWLHTDQSFTRNDFECIQSWITARDVNIGDATLVFLEGSHRYHKFIAENFAIDDPADWYMIPEDIQDMYHLLGCQLRRIKCQAGSMVLWDSRLIHCGSESLKGRPQINTRIIGYVCMMPRDQASPSRIQSRIKAYEENRMTAHNPIRGKLFPKAPRSYGKAIPKMVELPWPNITEVGRRLIGYTI